MGLISRIVGGKGVCGCPLACSQASGFVGNITTPPATASVGDAGAIRDWLNNLANIPCSMWSELGIGAEQEWISAWATVSTTSPTSVTNSCGFDNLPGGSAYAVQGTYTVLVSVAGTLVDYVANASNGFFITPDSTAYVVGKWCNAGSDPFAYQASCSLTGDPIGGCYQYYIPAPATGLVNLIFYPPNTTNSCYSAVYGLVPVTDPGNYYGGTWADLLSFCAANPTQCPNNFTTPSACLSPDPFFGSSPP
jgi:hypothetical protein